MINKFREKFRKSSENKFNLLKININVQKIKINKIQKFKISRKKLNICP